MRIVHLGIAVLSLFLVFVSVVRADDANPSQDQVLDDVSGAMNQPQPEGTYHQTLELKNGETLSLPKAPAADEPTSQEND